MGRPICRDRRRGKGGEGGRLFASVFPRNSVGSVTKPHRQGADIRPAAVSDSRRQETSARRHSRTHHARASTGGGRAAPAPHTAGHAAAAAVALSYGFGRAVKGHAGPHRHRRATRILRRRLHDAALHVGDSEVAEASQPVTANPARAGIVHRAAECRAIAARQTAGSRGTKHLRKSPSRYSTVHSKHREVQCLIL